MKYAVLSPQERAERGEDDDPAELHVAGSREDAGRDHQRLARDERDDRVEVRDREEQRDTSTRRRRRDRSASRTSVGKTMRVTFLPLEGVRVIDVTTSLAGPYCTEVLAALGADVVKVEPTDGGDEARSWGPPFWDGESTMFLAMNAGKRSVALDLRRGTDVLLRARRRRRRLRPEPSPRPRRRARPRRRDAARAEPTACPLLDHVVRRAQARGPRGPATTRSPRPPAGSSSVTGEPDRARRARRRLARRPGHRHVGRARRARRAHGARANG